jgi:hypothetical protein
LAVAKDIVTGSIAVPDSVTVKTKEVRVPSFPSFLLTSLIATLHSNLRSCRWFLSPQPLPGFVEVGVVVLVLVEVDVDVLVDVDVEVDVIVEVEVVVGVVVELVTVEVEVLVGVVVLVVDVLVEQYWYCDGVVQYW